LDRHANFAFFIERKFLASSPGLRICLSHMSRKEDLMKVLTHQRE
jgi:hypothetical protein